MPEAVRRHQARPSNGACASNVSTPREKNPDDDDPGEVVDAGLELWADASISGIGGAVLFQHGKPIAYDSQGLKGAHIRWSTTDQEFWATRHSLKTWRCYLEGYH